MFQPMRVAPTAKKLAAITLLAASSALAQSASQPQMASAPTETATAAHIDVAPVIDGRDDDPAWRMAAPITAFRVFDPVENGDPSVRTEARITYDRQNLYVFVRCFDPHPDSILPLLSRRDVKTSSDQVKLLIDSYHDRRTAFEFAVNPAGVKRDYLGYNDSQEDASWNAVWDVATRIDSLGWTAEFRIPLSQIRYPADAHVFGFMILREFTRTNERIAWPVFRRSLHSIASQFADVSGFTGLVTARHVEVAPYAVTRNRSAPSGVGGFQREQEQSVGGDLKYGVSSNITLDATINPDFGQVEADPAQLNLTAFETFLAEQRPFFLEGTNVFSFGENATELFYTRRIGRSPQLGGLAPDGADVPGRTPILGAVKMSGRLSNGTSIGTMTAVTQRVGVGDVTLEPLTTYAAVRGAQDFRNGETGIGFIATGVDRDLDSTTSPYLRRTAYTGGVDMRHRMMNRTLTFTGSLSGSLVSGDAAAIARTQRSSVHYYNRVGSGLIYDSTRTSLSGTDLALSATKTHGPLEIGATYQRYTPGYETNDLGFLSRADMQSADLQATMQSLKPAAFWRNATLQLNVTTNYTASGMPNGNNVELFQYAQLGGGSQLSADFWVENAGAAFCDRCARGGPAVRLSPDANLLVNLQYDVRSAVAPYFAAIYTMGDGGRSMLWRVRPYIVVRPRSNMSWEFGTRYQLNRDNTQWYANYGAAGNDTTHYVFAHLDQHLLSFTGRVNYTMTRDLSLQLYFEPFVTTGTFTNARELADPRARSYADRFRAYDAGALDGFNDKEFNSSAVLRWEYRPGSALFVVWTQARFGEVSSDGSFDATRDYRGLFGVRPDNTVLIKASYWIGR
jgi:Domain of unknown function (DUF5916)/Carbohydrate family 9 binding domain-like